MASTNNDHNFLDTLPFYNIYDATDFINCISEFMSNVCNTDFDINSVPILDVFDNVENIFEQDRNIDPDINIPNLVQPDAKYIKPCDMRLRYTDCDLTDLNMIHLNIRSLPKNHDVFLEVFHNVLNNMQVICMTETWISEMMQDLYNIPGFTSCHISRSKKRGGGVSILIKDNITFKILKNVSLSLTDIETLFIKIDKSLTNLNKPVIVGCCYRPPQGNPENFNIKICEILENLNVTDNYIYLHGDFNFNLFNINSSPSVNIFYNNLQSYCLYPLIDKPTRVTATSSTLIDNIFTNNISCEHRSNIVLTDISDHFPLMISVKNSHKPAHEKAEFIRIFSARNINYFKNQCDGTIFNNVLQNDNPQIAYKILHSLLTNAFNQAFPLVKKSKPYLNRLPWLNNELKQCIKIKNNLYISSKKDPTNEKTSLYKSYKCTLNRKIRLAKRQYYIKQLNDASKKIKDYWKTIKEIIGKPQIDSYPDHFLINNTEIYENQIISDAFNNYFANVGCKLADNIPNSEKRPTEYLKHPNNESFFLHPTTSNEVRKIFSEMNSSSAGWDGFNKKIITSVFENILPSITHIINKSFITGILPEEIKIAKLIPLYKADCPSTLSNYRPISVLPIISKFFEKLYHVRLYNFFNKHNIIHKLQFGFRKNHSTETALTILNHYISQSFENRSLSLGIFLDFSKAFDTVNFSILFKKLEHYGIRGIPLVWLKNYLLDRKQFVYLKDTISTSESIKMGVPQGSILGPLLFLIYINDLATVITSSKLIMYADDCSLILNGTSADDMITKANNDLDNIKQWLYANKLTLNIQKSKYMFFHSSSAQPKKTYKVEIDNRSLEEVFKFRFLGYMLDCQLKWNEHIAYITKKISKNIGVISKVSKVVNPDALRNLYYALIQPYIMNGIIVWGTAAATHIHPLKILQKRVIRITSKAKKYDSSAPLFKIHNILPINELYEYSVCNFMFKVHHNLTPSVVTELFKKRSTICRYITRQGNHFNIPLIRTSLAFRGSIYRKGPLLFNDCLKNYNVNCTLSTFQYHHKQQLLNKL